jgi:hypothetical protein
MSTTRRRSLSRGASCYKQIFAAVIGERLPGEPADSASTSRPPTSTRPSHSFLVAHHRLEVAPSSHLAPVERRPAQRRRRSAHVARCSSARNGQYTTAKPLPAVKMRSPPHAQNPGHRHRRPSSSAQHDKKIT